MLVLALASCYSGGPPAATPVNKVAPPDRVRAAEDVLAFLPVDSDVVMHLDLARLRASPLWDKQISRIIIAMAGQQLDEFRQHCGFDLITAIDRISLALKSSTDGGRQGVVVGHGRETRRGLECAVREGTKAGAVTVDGNVVLVKNKGDTAAVTTVGRSTVVAHLAHAADRKSLEVVTASGSPLRGSPAFLSLFEQLESGASLWFTINGSSPTFAALASTGFKARTIDGTLTIGDSYVLAARIRATSPDEATRMSTMIDGSAGAVRPMVEAFAVRAEGDVVRVDVVVTETQAQTILTMFGGFLGP